MKDSITTMYCLCDDFLKAMHYRDDAQATMSTAEVMTVALTAAAYYGGNLETSRTFLHEHGYMPHMLSQSRLNRRLHAIPPLLWQGLFVLLAEVFKQHNSAQTYVVDSLPVPVCDNIRIRRCRLYPRAQHGDTFRGYIASKRRYFYGLRVHLVVTGQGEPVEFSLAAGSEADVTRFRDLDLDLPAGCTLYADRAYTDYDYEDVLEAAGLHLQAQRKKNSKRPLPLWREFVGQPIRQYIETVFGQVTNGFPKHIHAVTPQGFELKIVCFLLVFAIQCL